MRAFFQQKSSQCLVVSSLLAVAAAFGGPTAQAASITGQVNFIGSVVGKSASNQAVSDWSNAVKLVFNGVYGGVALKQSLNGNIEQTGAYASLTGLFTKAMFKDFAFKPALSPLPVNPLWSFTASGKTYSFTLNSIEIMAQGSSFLTLRGLGVAHATGYDDTSGVFDFSSQGKANKSFKFGFSADALSVVPLPAAIYFAVPALLSVFGVFGRKRNGDSLA